LPGLASVTTILSQIRRKDSQLISGNRKIEIDFAFEERKNGLGVELPSKNAVVGPNETDNQI
jgi:hypothetical protein